MANIKPYRHDAEQLRRLGDLRDAALFTCDGCDYEFWAPVARACPRCACARLTVVQAKQIQAPRV